MKTGTQFLLVLALVSGIVAGAGSKDQGNSGTSEDWRRGRAVYVANCIACHNRDPSKDGPLGPAVLGSPKELLEALLLRNEYPP
ncbi:MAG: c-type cytochrome, partial [Candidatus Binatia bacterium]